VTAPRRVELNEHILALIQHDLVEVLRGQDDDVGGRSGDLDASASLAVDEVDDIIGITTARVVFRGSRALREELQSREALDTKSGAEFLVLVGVDLGNDDIAGLAESFTELFIFRSHSFAMTAPRGVKFDEDVLGAVDNRIEVLGREFLHGSDVAECRSEHASGE
jgi:hypothetical protein